MSSTRKISPHQTWWDNYAEVDRLLQIHAQIAGAGPGYKHNVEVLNKSAIVVLVACWEAFVEDLAEKAFDILLRHAKGHDEFSNKVLVAAAKPLRDSKDERAVWQLAGNGWKAVLRRHRSALLERHIGRLNTPRPDQVDAIYEALLGLKLSSSWHWPGMSTKKAKKKLNALVDLRGRIAHRVKATRKVHKSEVRDYISFMNRLAMETSNAVHKVIVTATGNAPWRRYRWP